MNVVKAPSNQKNTPTNRILVVKGQGIGPECIAAAKKTLSATGVSITYSEGTLGYPDAVDLIPLLCERAPEAYAEQFGQEDPGAVALRLESEARKQAKAGGNVNDFYKKLLSKLQPKLLAALKGIIVDLEKQTLLAASQASAVLKGALRTLDEGDEPSRNVTIRKAFEQYANIRRCVTLDPIAPGMPGADILFVRENVEDLYASIEHRLARNYPQALRHQTPEGCELIIRAAFEAGLRDGRKKVTGLEKPNILKITGGLFKEVFLRVAKDYSKEKLGERGMEANFMIIDDGLAAIGASPAKFDVVVTTNMFGDIGSDIAAKVTGGVGLVSSNNINPINPRAVSMFETMGGTADDIAGQNKANPVALIDAAAEMLIHIGGSENLIAAELIKAAVLEVLAEGYYVGDIKKGPYQEAKGKEKLGTQEFTDKIIEKILELKEIREAHPEKTVKEIAVQRASADIRPLFERVLRSYAQYAADITPGGSQWIGSVIRNTPPNPVRASSRIIGFDMFVDDSGVRAAFSPDGSVDPITSVVDPEVSKEFNTASGIQLRTLFNEGNAGSLQSVRSFGQHSALVFRKLLTTFPEKAPSRFGELLTEMNFPDSFSGRFAEDIKQLSVSDAVAALEKFDVESIKLIQSFYRARARELEPVLKEHGFQLARITSRGTEIYPTMCDFEKRDVDRYRIEIDPNSSLVQQQNNGAHVQVQILSVQSAMARKGWIISETMLNRSFTDGEGASKGKEMSGVSVPYAKNLGNNYSGRS